MSASGLVPKQSEAKEQESTYDTEENDPGGESLAITQGGHGMVLV